MKNLSILTLFVAFSMFAAEKSDRFASPRIEGKAGYFFFSNQKMKDIYSNGGFEILVTGSYPVYKQLQLYGSAGFRELSGNSVNFRQKALFWEIPVDIGLKPIFKLTNYIDWYFAFGPRYFYLQQNNQSNFVDKTVVKNGVGLFVNTAFDFFISDHCFIDLFGEYSYEPVSISPHQSEVIGRSIDVGGFFFGAGFGYSF